MATSLPSCSKGDSVFSTNSWFRASTQERMCASRSGHLSYRAWSKAVVSDPLGSCTSYSSRPTSSRALAKNRTRIFMLISWFQRYTHYQLQYMVCYSAFSRWHPSLFDTYPRERCIWIIDTTKIVLSVLHKPRITMSRTQAMRHPLNSKRCPNVEPIIISRICSLLYYKIGLLDRFIAGAQIVAASGTNFGYSKFDRRVPSWHLFLDSLTFIMWNLILALSFLATSMQSCASVKPYNWYS